jgi:glycosyltransferase involved in cell wall biosynthesis
MIGKNHMGKRILVISPAHTHPQYGGNSERIYSLLLNLKDLGNDVYFAHVKKDEGDEEARRQFWGEEKFYPLSYEMPKAAWRSHYFSGHRIVRMMQKTAGKLLSIWGNDPYFTFSIDDFYDESINRVLLDLSKSINPDTVIVEYVFFSKALECFDNDVLKIIDTHDVYADRYKLYLKNKQNPPQGWYSTTKRQENIGLNRADIIIAIQKNEADLFKKRLNYKKIATVPHIVPLQEPYMRNFTNRILFIGSKSKQNTYSINYLIKDIFPLVKSKFKNAQLIVVESICDRVDNFEDCIKLGKVDNLKDVYDMADVAINPIRAGTGLKIKNIEALGYAKPLITTAIGAEGLEEGAGRAFLIAESPEDFVDCITKIFTDKSFYENLSRNAYNFAHEWNQNCLNALKEVLEDA